MKYFDSMIALLTIKKKFFIPILGAFCPHVCIVYVPGAQGSQKRVLDALEVELRITVRHHVYSGNQT